MPLDFATLRRRIRQRTANKLDDVRAEILLREKIEELWYREPWSWRQDEAVLTTVAPKSGGTVTLNATPTLVDGTGTAFAAADVGRKLRVANDNTYYEVTAVSGQQLTLETAYAGTAFTASAYSLFRNIYPLATNFKEMISIAYWWRLSEGTVGGVDRYDARRSFTSQQPASFIYRGEDSAGVMQVEISPVPSAAIGIHYVYRNKPPTWADTTYVPFNETALTYLCASDALYQLAIEEPAQAQAYIMVADKYQALGQNALAEHSFSDTKLRSIQKSVRDEGMTGAWPDDYAVSHDVYGPI
mgnify:FL=1